VSSFDAPSEDQLLTLHETASEVTVSYAGEDDWVVRFEKSNHFPALAWAQNMVECFNAKRETSWGPPAEASPAPVQ
jgi:hypothetical protein